MITILTTLPYKGKKHPFLAKQFHREEVVDYDKSYTYDTYEIPCDDIYQLLNILEQLSDDPHTCIIRAKLKDEVIPKNILRQKSKKGSPFQENPHGVPFIMIDMDQIPYPSDLPQDEAFYREFLISLLPDYFHYTTYVYQWSSKAGVNGWSELRCHLWFWLDEPRTDTQLMNWASSLPEECPIDDSVFRTVQIHYTASPIFHDGIIDPVKKRVGFVKKDNETVSIPLVDPPLSNITSSGKFIALPHPPGLKNKFDLRLEAIGPRYHNRITEAVGSWFALTGPNSDLGRLKEILRDRILSAPGEGSCGKSYYSSDAYLSHEIRSCHFSHKPNGPDRMPETDKERIIYKLSNGQRIKGAK